MEDLDNKLSSILEQLKQADEENLLKLVQELKQSIIEQRKANIHHLSLLEMREKQLLMDKYGSQFLSLVPKSSQDIH